MKNLNSFAKLTDIELFDLFKMKYGDPETTGWSPRRRLKYGYYFPGDVYEATVRKFVNSETSWVDIGGGRALFPDNPSLSESLAHECKRLVAVDPSDNVFENPYAHDKVMSMFEDFETEEKFDLATFRMVAEHIGNPEAVLSKLREILSPNGVAIIYTINRYSPVPIITALTPFSWHYKIKNFFWGGEEKDTFPVEYKMNTRKVLTKMFADHEFDEISFQYLDDLSTFAGFYYLNLLELWAWKALNSIGVGYPENNLLGIYQRKG